MEQSNGYKLIRQTGAGLAGAVWVGDGPTGRVAMRRFSSEAARDTEEWLADRAFFLVAGRSALTLKHRRIVAVSEVLDDGEDAWIAMEFVQDETLDALLKRERLPIGQTIYMLRLMALALDYAHQSGVTHGDLKPSNVFVGDKRAIRLTDFAVSPRARRNPRGILNSAWVHPYISPEHLIAPALIGPKSDLYSLGALAYHMLSGTPPFLHGDTSRANEDPGPGILRGQLTPASTVNKALPPGIDGPLLKALSRDPNQRYSNCVEFVEALEAVTAPAAIAVGQAGANPSPKLMYAGIGSLVAALGVAAALLLGGGKKGPPTRTDPPPVKVVQNQNAASNVAEAGDTGPRNHVSPSRNTNAGTGTDHSSGAPPQSKPHPFDVPVRQAVAEARPPEARQPVSLRLDPSSGLSGSRVPGPEPGRRTDTGFPFPPTPAAPSPVTTPVRSVISKEPPPPLSMEGVPKGFSLVLFSRNKQIGPGISFGFRDQTLGEMGAGDLKAQVRVNGPAGKGRLSLLWSIDGTTMDAVTVAPNTISEYRNEPTPGTYRVVLRQDLKPVAEYTFRITP